MIILNLLVVNIVMLMFLNPTKWEKIYINNSPDINFYGNKGTMIFLTMSPASPPPLYESRKVYVAGNRKRK